MTPPLRISFDVDCSAEHAFTVWTSGIGTWWPDRGAGDASLAAFVGYLRTL